MDRDLKARLPRLTTQFRDYAKNAKQKRMDINKFNMDMFNMRQDFSNKKPGQSTEFIPKIGNAVNKFVNFFKQGLVDNTSWFSIELEPGVTPGLITPDIAEKILGDQLKKAKFTTHLEDALQTGALQSLMISKVHGEMVDKSTFRTEDVEPEEEDSFEVERKVKLIKETKKVWQLRLDNVRPENYYPDPTGDNLFKIEETFLDHYSLVETAKANKDVFNYSAVKDLRQSSDANFQDSKLSRETDQNMMQEPKWRKRIRITEFWGTLLNDDGELQMENCMYAIADDKTIIIDPRPNEYWHGEDPYVVSPILRISQSVWHTAIMDTPARLNAAQNELFNLMLDGGIMSVWGINQINPEKLADPTQIDDGIPAGTTLVGNSQLLPGEKIFERVSTGQIPSDANNMYNLTEKELNASSFENSYSMGTVADRQVKATEIVAANQAQSGVFAGLVKAIEENFVNEILRKSWLTCCQMMNDMDEDRLNSLIGEDAAQAILALSPEERFAQTVSGFKFRTYGMSETLNKMSEFRKMEALLRTIAASPDLLMKFNQTFDMGKTLEEMMRSLDIDVSKIKITNEAGQPTQAAPELPLSAQEGAGGDMMSQIAQGMAGSSGQGAPMEQILSGGMTTPMGTETR